MNWLAYEHYAYAALAVIGTGLAVWLVDSVLQHPVLGARLQRYSGVVAPFINVNAMLFGLNGYVLEQLDAHSTILNQLEAEIAQEESPATPRVPAVTHPERIYTDADQPRLTPPADTDRSFTALFRRDKA